MLRKGLFYFVLTSFIFSSLSGKGAVVAFADETVYYDENPEAFNRGALVGEEGDEYRRARRNQILKNWGLAVGAVAIGVITIVLVGKNHDK